MTDPEVVVGLDLGTSGLKAVAMTLGGELIASAVAEYPTLRPEPGQAEQEPADWWAAAGGVIGALSAEIPAEHWAAVALSGMIPTLVAAGADGEPIGRAITWEDDRAEADGDRFREAVGGAELYAATGQWVDGRYLLPMFRRLQREEPEGAAATRWILGAKDHVFHRLTGQIATDPSTATGFGCFALSSGTWDASLAGADEARLPPVRPTTHIAPMHARAAGELGLPTGLPVALGAADSVCGALGMGATWPGARVSLWGTSTVIVGISGSLVLDPEHRYLVTPLALGEGWGLEMDLVSTGSAVAWLAGLLGISEGDLSDLAGNSPFGAGGVTFLPYLGFGEQGALWDPTLRGAIEGLTLAHRREDLCRALLEGIALEVRRCAQVLDDSGVPPGPMVMAGGGAGAEAFATMIAGATRAPVSKVADERWVSARGAAIVAAAAAGSSPDVTAPPSTRTIEPTDADRWDALDDRYRRRLEALRAYRR